jgi:acetyl-CoA acyltransferase
MIPMGGHRLAANFDLVQQIPSAYMPMGLTAEQVAEKYSVSRALQDEFSYQSHQKALKAQNNGWFDEEIVPVEVVFEKKSIIIKKDEGPRADTSLEALAKLKPVFKTNGTVTAGNASQLSDGAACSVLMNARVAKDRSLDVLGYFRDFVTVGVPPEIMGIGPVPAILKLLKKNNLNINDIGVFEINEAFAAQAYYCVKELKINPEKVNIGGGAIALGHPLGCTGARQVATILRHMQRTNSRYGICSMCIGGGMGAAGLIEIV